MQYIVFTLGETYYGIATDKVEEISKTFSSTYIPQSPAWVEGLINLRGQILTLINFDNLLNSNNKTSETCYNNTIIAQTDDNQVALMVEKVVGVVTVNDDELQAVPEDQKIATAFFQAFGHVVSVIELNRFFSEKEG